MHESLPASTQKPIFSEFADDPDFADLLEMFAESLDEKQQVFRESFRDKNFDQLKIHAHQLKGSGAGYGFGELSTLAADLELACKENDVDRVGQALDQVIGYIARIQI